MSLFGDIDIASAAEIVYPTIPDGPHLMVVTDVQVKSGKQDPDSKFLVIEFTHPELKLSIEKWLGIPQGNPALWSDEIIPGVHENFNTERKRMEANRSNIKQVLVEGLNVPVDRVNNVNREDLIDLEAIVTVGKQKRNPEYTEIKSVKQRGNSGMAMPVASSPSAPMAKSTVPVVTGGSPFSPK